MVMTKPGKRNDSEANRNQNLLLAFKYDEDIILDYNIYLITLRPVCLLTQVIHLDEDAN